MDLKDSQILVSSLTDNDPFSGDSTLPNISTGATAEDTVNASND